MVNKSSRELLSIPAEWSIPQIIAALKAALDGSGPALAFSQSQFTHVDSEVAVVIPTSGSTGTPKEVALTAAALRASASASHNFLGAKKGERWSLQLPTHHIAGVNVLVRSLELDSELSDGGFEYTSIVPTQLYRALKESGEDLIQLQNAKAVLVGGASTSAELLHEAKSRGVNVVTTYGMSEMSGGCIYNNRPLDGVDVEIRDGGRIALRGAMQAREYLGASLPLSDSQGWFLTSDAGYLEDGKLYVTGRVDDFINTGGEKISLSAIDLHLYQEFKKEFMSCAVKSEEWGDQLCLASSVDFDSQVISESLRSKFGKHAVPKLFMKNIDLPKTSLAKPDRATLGKLFDHYQS
jgi:O-succinylbenzoic acid--CoA ligase